MHYLWRKTGLTHNNAPAIVRGMHVQNPAVEQRGRSSRTRARSRMRESINRLCAPSPLCFSDCFRSTETTAPAPASAA